MRDACLAAEQRYGLRSTAPGDRTAARQPSRAESEKAARRGLEEAPRVTLRRQVSTAAAAAASEQEFFARLRQSGVLVRTRHSTRDPGQVTGYAVALPGDTTKAGDPVWYGGGKLAADLSLPKLRRRWPRPGAMTVSPPRSVARPGSTPRRSWTMPQPTSGDCSPGDDPGAAADAAWATADTLHAAAAALGSRILRQAADAYDRAARAPYGRIPAPTPAGDGLRRAARLLSAYGYITSDPSFRPLVLIVRLAALAEAVADLRQTQQHAAQAASALRAAEQLHAARGIYAAPAAAGHLPAQSAAALADAGFPVPPGPVPAGPPAPAPTSPRTRPPAPPRPGQQPRRH